MHVKDFSPLRFTLAYKSIWLRPLSNPIYFCVKRLDFKKYKALISLLLTSKLLTWQSGLGVMQICSMTFALCVKLNKKNVLCSVLLPTHIRYADFWCILKHGREKLRSLIWQWKNKNKPVKSCRTEIGIWPIHLLLCFIRYLMNSCQADIGLGKVGKEPYSYAVGCLQCVILEPTVLFHGTCVGLFCNCG